MLYLCSILGIESVRKYKYKVGITVNTLHLAVCIYAWNRLSKLASDNIIPFYIHAHKHRQTHAHTHILTHTHVSAMLARGGFPWHVILSCMNILYIFKILSCELYTLTENYNKL